jgi:hypothetical protein
MRRDCRVDWRPALTMAMPNNNRFTSFPPPPSWLGAVPGEFRISSWDPQRHRTAGDCTRSSLCRSWPVFVLSPDCQRRAKRRGQEETKHGRIECRVKRMWHAGTAKNAPLPKGPINPSQRPLRPAQRPLRLVGRTSQHQRCPDSHPTMTYGSGQLPATPTINRRNQDV